MNKFTCQDISLCANALVDVSIVIQSWQHITIPMLTVRKKGGGGGRANIWYFWSMANYHGWAKSFTLMWLTHTRAHLPPVQGLGRWICFHYFVLNPRWEKQYFSETKKT